MIPHYELNITKIIVYICLSAGGLTAVMWTDTIQTAIMLVGALYLMALGELKRKSSKIP